MHTGFPSDRLPAVDGDRILRSAIDAGMGLFTIALQAEFSHALDRLRLARAVDVLLDAQPILGCRFVVDGLRLYWERLRRDGRPAFHFFDSQQAYEQFATAQVDSRTGPQVLVGLRSARAGDRLTIKISHQVGDGRGLYDTARALSCIYSRLQSEPDYRPAPAAVGSRSGRQILRRIPWTAAPAILKHFVKLAWANSHPPAALSLPLPPWQPASWSYAIRRFSPGRTARVISWGKEHQATLNDLFLAAYLRALAGGCGWDGRSALRAVMTVDLCSWYLPAKNAGGICNLSAFEYVNLGTDLGGDFHGTACRVRDLTQARKACCFGLGDIVFAPLVALVPHPLLTGMFARALRIKAATKNAPGMLTNTGRIPPEIISFDGPAHAAWLLPHVLFPPDFCIGVSSYGEAITLAAGASLNASGLVEAFFDRMAAELPG